MVKVLVLRAGDAGFKFSEGKCCIPSTSEENMDQCATTPIPTKHLLICEKSKGPGIPYKVVLLQLVLRECQLQNCNLFVN